MMLVLITNTGRVEQRVVDCPGPVDDALLGDLRARINARRSGRRLTEVADARRRAACVLRGRPTGRPSPPSSRPWSRRSSSDSEERVVLGGTANLTRFGQDFPATVQPVLEALEEQVVLLRLLGEASDPDEVTVRIGHENPVEGLSGTSVVTVGYGAGDEAVARLGVVGPDPDGLPGHDRRRARRRPLRRPRSLDGVPEYGEPI